MCLGQAQATVAENFQ